MSVSDQGIVTAPPPAPAPINHRGGGKFSRRGDGAVPRPPFGHSFSLAPVFMGESVSPRQQEGEAGPGTPPSGSVRGELRERIIKALARRCEARLVRQGGLSAPESPVVGVVCSRERGWVLSSMSG